MFPGFVFCASYAWTHVYRSWFAVAAMKARTHFCVFNGVVFSVDGCFLVLVRLCAVWYVPICDALFISTRLASLFSFLRISAVLMAEFHIIFASILYLKRLFLCFNYIFAGFLYIIGTFVPFIALFGVVFHSKSTTLEACFVICAIWLWVSRPPAWWLRALLRIMVFCNEEIAGTWACQTFKLAYTRRTVNRSRGSTLV